MTGACPSHSILLSTMIYQQAAELYLKYAKLEEDHGLVRHAMAIYDRATKVQQERERGRVKEMKSEEFEPSRLSCS